MEKITWSSINNPHDAPTNPGVYQYVAGGEILYIGKAISLRARLLSHAQNARLDAKERAIVTGATEIRYCLVDSDFLALLLESQLISRHQPPYNLIAKDDKSYLYISLDLHDEFPKPRLVRGKDLPIIRSSTFKIHNFGPFPSSAVAEEILRSIRRLIPFCMQTKVGKRGCFYSHVGLCSPCPSNIRKLPPAPRELQTKLYRSQIRQIIRILRGKTEPVITSLTNRMQRLSRQLRYEEALELRKKIERFQHWIDTHAFSDTRVIVMNQSSERLASLQSLLSSNYSQLSSLHRIECYDASNLLSQFGVVSLVVLTDGRIDKSQYRRFRIRNPRAGSDFSRIREALVRRFKHKWPIPDLIVIDGGKPQVRMALQVLDQIANPPALLGLAKAPDRLIIPKSSPTRTTFVTVNPPTNHPGFNLLKLLRDESHRFANSYRVLLEKRQNQL